MLPMKIPDRFVLLVLFTHTTTNYIGMLFRQVLPLLSIYTTTIDMPMTTAKMLSSRISPRPGAAHFPTELPKIFSLQLQAVKLPPKCLHLPFSLQLQAVKLPPKCLHLLPQSHLPTTTKQIPSSYRRVQRSSNLNTIQQKESF